MELRQLRYFLAVAENRHFGRAARDMHITQPPLSMQIQRLEKELGVALFTRSTRQVDLTDAGRAFEAHVKRILRDVEHSARDARNAGSGLAGFLDVGFISSATLSVIPPALNAFAKRYPAVSLTLKELTSGQQLDALYDGTIQIGLIRLPVAAPGIQVEPLLSETLVVALPENHALAACPALGIDLIADERLVFFGRQDIPGFHDHVQALFQRHGYTPKIGQRVKQLQTIIGLVAGGAGIAILPGSSRYLHRDGIVYRPLEIDASESTLATVHLATAQTVLLNNFRHTLRAVASRLAARDGSVFSLSSN